MAHSAGGKRSLLGKWKIIRNGSDFLPGLDQLNEGPLVLKLNGHHEIEFFKIERKAFEDKVEEVQLAYVSRNRSDSQNYQLCALNYENVHGNDIELSIVKNCNEDFTELTVCHLGPKSGQNSVEQYKLNDGTGEVQVSIEITTADGVRFSVIKYLTRFEDAEVQEEFKLSKYTIGWSVFDIWPSSLLSSASLVITRALKVRSQDSRQGAKILVTLWTNPAHPSSSIFDMFAITRTMGTLNKEGEEVVMYVIQITVGESIWYVARRYREFDALRRFLLGQNPFVQEFQQLDGKFPGKALSTYRRSLVEHRATALTEFYSTYLKESRYCRQTSIDALCSFLQLPEHMYEAAQKKLQMFNAELAEEDKSVTSAGDLPLPRRPPSATTSIAGVFNVGHAKTAGGGTSKAGGSQEGSEPKRYVERRLSARGPALASPQMRLLQAMGDRGMAVIKHGRQGNPKRRTLFLSSDGGQIIIQAEDHYKTVKLAGVTSIRLGTDIDPATPPAALQKGPEPEAEKARRRSSFLKFGAETTILFGTHTLRRSCDPKKMDMCISLILPTRTVDFQCLNVEDLRTLKDCLTEICSTNVPE